MKIFSSCFVEFLSACVSSKIYVNSVFVCKKNNAVEKVTEVKWRTKDNATDTASQKKSHSVTPPAPLPPPPTKIKN